LGLIDTVSASGKFSASLVYEHQHEPFLEAQPAVDLDGCEHVADGIFCCIQACFQFGGCE